MFLLCGTFLLMLFEPAFGRITTNDDVGKSPSVATNQEKSISGTVRSMDDGSGLPGVNIIEKGTSNCAECAEYKCNKLEKFIAFAPSVGEALAALR